MQMTEGRTECSGGAEPTRDAFEQPKRRARVTAVGLLQNCRDLHMGCSWAKFYKVCHDPYAKLLMNHLCTFGWLGCVLLDET
jgi:hypothetical protein